MTPWYTDQEVNDLCAGLHTNAAMCRHLRAQGLTVTQKPNGRVLLIRSHAEAVLAGMQAVMAEADKPIRNVPNKAALIALFGGRKLVS